MRTLRSVLPIDGTHGEGGGALLRTELAVSALTQQPVQISHIRGSTKFPGLNPEDLTVAQVLASICDAEMTGAELGSHSITFVPRRAPMPFRGEAPYIENASGRGFACSQVVAASLLPVLARAGGISELRVLGETYGLGILTYDYFEHVTLGALRRLGLYAYSRQISAGFGRSSKGEIGVEIEPSVLHGIQWSAKGRLESMQATIAISQLSPTIAERGLSHLQKLANHANVRLDVEVVEPPCDSSGVHVTIWSEYDTALGGATSMGQRSIRMEAVVQSAFDSFMEWHNSEATVDTYLGDQILLAAAFAETESTFVVQRLTERFLTIAWVIKQFLPIRITIRGNVNELGLVSVKR